MVNHGSGEFVRGNVYTNTAEGFISLLKRGIVGTFHHVGKGHLGKYVSEFEFRYNARKVADAQRPRAHRAGGGRQAADLQAASWSGHELSARSFAVGSGDAPRDCDGGRQGDRTPLQDRLQRPPEAPSAAPCSAWRRGIQPRLPLEP